MRKTKFLKICIALLLVAVLMTSVAGCGRSDNQGANTASSAASSMATAAESVSTARETVNLVITNVTSDMGTTENDVLKFLNDKFSLRITTVFCDADKYKLLLASGDIGDISTCMLDQEQIVLSSNLAKDLTDMMPTIGSNFVKLHPEAMDSIRKFHSGGTGKQFFLPRLTGSNEPPLDLPLPLTGPYIRWDYYKELGYPEVKNYDEYLNLLKQMQDKHPKTEDGKKVYGLSIWNDYGVIWGMLFPTMVYEGCLNYTDWFSLTGSGEIKNTYTDPNGPLWTSLKLLHKAWNMGLVDPDYFINKGQQFLDKLKAGQLLTSPLSWFISDANNNFVSQGHPEQGFGLLLGPVPHVPVSSRDSSVLGLPNLLFITSSCKNPDRALELLDYLTTEEGSRLAWSGIKGKHWDVVDGKPQITQEYYDLYKKDLNTFVKQTGIGSGAYANLSGYAGVANASDGDRTDLYNSKEVIAKNLTPIDKDVCAHYGVTIPMEAAVNFVKAGKAKDACFNTAPQAFMPNMPNDLHNNDTKAVSYIERMAPKAVMAKTDEEFERIKQQIIKEVAAYGVNDGYSWLSTEWAKAVETLNGLGKN